MGKILEVKDQNDRYFLVEGALDKAKAHPMTDNQVAELHGLLGLRSAGGSFFNLNGAIACAEKGGKTTQVQQVLEDNLHIKPSEHAQSALVQHRAQVMLGTMCSPFLL